MVCRIIGKSKNPRPGGNGGRPGAQTRFRSRQSTTTTRTRGSNMFGKFTGADGIKAPFSWSTGFSTVLSGATASQIIAPELCFYPAPATEWRQKIAHGVSRGKKSGRILQPRQGRQNPPGQLCRHFVAFPGEDGPFFPRLTPRGNFSRCSAACFGPGLPGQETGNHGRSSPSDQLERVNRIKPRAPVVHHRTNQFIHGFDMVSLCRRTWLTRRHAT